MKPKEKKILIIGAVTVVGVGLAYLLMKGKKGNTAVLPPTPPTPTEEACLTFPIKRGAGYTKTCEVPAVKMIQTWINDQDWTVQTWVDGKFGTDTEETLFYYTGQRTVDQAFYAQIKSEVASGYKKTV